MSSIRDRMPELPPVPNIDYQRLWEALRDSTVKMAQKTESDPDHLAAIRFEDLIQTMRSMEDAEALAASQSVNDFLASLQ